MFASSTSAGDPNPVLEVSGLSFGYAPAQPLMENVAVTLQPGRLCVVLGPNAAGKSTLLKLLMGQLKPWQGNVRLAGRDVMAMPASMRAGWMSYVPQRGGTSFAYTVQQVVEMGRFALPRQESAIQQAIHACDLADLTHRVYSELSVGQQQRVLLARAMAQSAGQGKLMLLDEPGSAMDLRHIHGMMHTLTQLASRGLAVLVVLHDLNIAARYADEIWLMDQGRMVAAGPWREVLEPGLLSRVYQMKLAMLELENHARPVFTAETPQYT